MRIAIMGGSFNPVTLGHLQAAKYVHDTQGVDEVWWIPVYKHPFAKELVPFEHRDAMCRAVKDAEGLEWLQVSDLEKKIAEEKKVAGEDPRVFAVEVLERIKGEHPSSELVFAVGSDIGAGLPGWRSRDRIYSLVQEVLVLNRPPIKGPFTWPGLKHLYRFVYELAKKNPLMPAVSSTQARRKKLPPNLVHAVVRAYAKRKGLYGLRPE